VSAREPVMIGEQRLPHQRRAVGVAGLAAGLADGWGAVAPHIRHSRRVALLKRLLPVIGVALLLLIAVWPRLAPLWERMRLAFPAINLRDARELDMIKPRYAGVDRDGHPFVVTAASGRQLPDRQDLMSLRSPRADIKTHSGANIAITAETGIYQQQTQVLDVFGDVTLTHQNGTRFVTQSARVEAASNRAEGDQPVTGHGPSGDLTAQGFRVLDKGDKILFTGRSDLLLRSAKPTAPKHPPAGLPAPVAAAARQAAVEARPLLAAAHPPPIARLPTATHAAARRPVAHAHRRTTGRQAARHTPVRRKPVAPQPE
jgi:lipopolysaccharide export system protein LptC